MLSDTPGVAGAPVGGIAAAAADRKMLANAAKYPVDKARGTAKKYTEL